MLVYNKADMSRTGYTAPLSSPGVGGALILLPQTLALGGVFLIAHSLITIGCFCRDAGLERRSPGVRIPPNPDRHGRARLSVVGAREVQGSDRLIGRSGAHGVPNTLAAGADLTTNFGHQPSTVISCPLVLTTSGVAPARTRRTARASPSSAIVAVAARGQNLKMSNQPTSR